MLKRSAKLRMRRLIRDQQKQAADIGQVTEDTIDKHFFKRLARLSKVKRFVIGWLILMALVILITVLQFGALGDKYKKLTYVPGGSLDEGIVGSYTDANPIYASSSVDASVSKLLFSGLLSYDANHKLINDLASNINIDKTEKVYTVTLKDGLYWHDGVPLTAKDVVFTFNTIQNPDAKSYLLSSWRGIKIEAKNDKTIVFTLQNSLSSFPHSLTTGIIPAHILKGVPLGNLRSSDFNTTKPIGSGPFKFETVEVQQDKEGIKKEQIGLIANDKYYRGQPGIKRYVIKTFKDQSELEQAYYDKKINAMAGLPDVPKNVEKDKGSGVYKVPLTGETMVFFKMSSGLLKDSNVRKALVLGANRQDIIGNTGQTLQPSNEPLLVSQIGYDKKFAQKTNNVPAARRILTAAGWKVNPATGMRFKRNIPLKFKLFALSNSEYSSVANTLKKQWKDIGVEVEVVLQSDEDQKNTVSSHDYNALLASISLGADPDVYPFWHSSQFDIRSNTRLNFSEYKSAKSDASLEAGRSRSNPVIRAIKYKPFLAAWKADNPALALYQPIYIFIVRSPFDGFNNTSLVSPTDRYSNVEKWLVRQDRRSD